MGELYGEVNPLTMEWRDGLLGISVRTAVQVPKLIAWLLVVFFCPYLDLLLLMCLLPSIYELINLCLFLPEY